MENEMEINIKKFIKFINNKQWDKIESFMHEDVEFTDPFCPDAVKGIEKTMAVLKEQVKLFPDYEYEVVRTFSEENHGVLELVRSGKKIIWNQREFEVAYSVPEVVLIDTEDNLIKSYRGFFDVGRILRLIDTVDKKPLGDAN